VKEDNTYVLKNYLILI